MSDTPHIRVELQSNPAFLCGARELIASVSKRIGFDDLDCSKIALAVDEALCNIIRHGYKRQSDKPIWISLWKLDPVPGSGLETGGLRIIIDDLAKQVDPDRMIGRDLEDIRPGGLGVHIIREVMDEVTYERREGAEGMRLILLKRCPLPDPKASLAQAVAKTALKNPQHAR